jgi:hypothetical protein
MIKDNIATYAAAVGGMLLIALGLIGFWFPGLPGMRLGVVVNLAHLVSGAVALYLGLNAKSLAGLQVLCLGLGVLYGLAGLAFAWHLALPSITHLFHLIVGAGFLWAGMVQPLATATPRAHETK